MTKYAFIAIILLLVLVSLSGCVLDQVIKAGESGSKTYETIKNANSLGTVADGVKTLAETRKVKAKTTEDFVKTTGVLIAQQPIEAQHELIKQAIQAKVTMSNNDAVMRGLGGFLIGAGLILLFVVLKYLVDRVAPKYKKVTHEQ